MKRALIATALAGALLASQAGGASADEYAGGAKRGDELRVGFQAVFVNDRPEEVRHFHFRRVPMECEVGTPFRTKSDAPHFGPMNVNDERRFHGVFSANHGDVKVVIRGEFKPRRIVGTLRVSGDYPPRMDCSSGRVEWMATLSD